MSLYALLQYNDTFQPCGGAVALHLGGTGKLSGLVGRAKLEPGTVLYMDYGSREMGNHDGMRCGFAEMCSKIMIRGIHLTSRLVPGGTHSEASWEKQLPFVIHTLMYEVEVNPQKGGTTMEMQYFKEYSPELVRDMECKLYGHAGRPMLYIPCQDGRFFDFEDFHMADTPCPMDRCW